MGAHAASGGTTHRSLLLWLHTKWVIHWQHSNTHTVQGHHLAKPHMSCQVLAVVVVVNSLTITHYQCTDLGYLFVTNFRYRLIRGSLIFVTFSAVGMGVGLYAGRLISEYIWYMLFHHLHYNHSYLPSLIHWSKPIQQIIPTTDFSPHARLISCTLQLRGFILLISFVLTFLSLLLFLFWCLCLSACCQLLNAH